MADIQLSAQLFDDIQQAVERQQPGADHGVTLQYLAAVTGYFLGNQTHLSGEQRAAFLDELCAFARHVADDVGERRREREGAAQQSAVGYWEPPKS